MKKILLLIVLSSIALFANENNYLKIENNSEYCVGDLLHLNLDFIEQGDEIYNLKFLHEGKSVYILNGIRGDIGKISVNFYQDLTGKYLTLVFVNTHTNSIEYQFENVLFKSIPVVYELSHNKNYCLGEKIELVAKTSGKNLTYRWFHNSNLIEGATSSFLTIDKADYENSGEYYFTVSNDCASVSSEQVFISIGTDIQIIEQPESAYYIIDERINFSVETHSPKPVQYQWYKDDLPLEDGNRIVGSKSNRLSISKMRIEDVGFYHVEVTGDCGVVQSEKAELEDKNFFDIFNLSGDFQDCEGSNVRFRIEVEQYIDGELEYQWYKTGRKALKDDERISGANTKVLLINDIEKADENRYYCDVTFKGVKFTKRSRHFTLRVNTKPRILSTSPNPWLVYDVNSGALYGTVYISVRTEGIGNIYRWYKNGEFYAEKSDISAGVMRATEEPWVGQLIGDWHCEIRNACGVTYSDTIRVEYGFKEIRICMGEEVSIELEPSKWQPDQVKYSWRLNDTINIDESYGFEGLDSYTLYHSNIDSIHYGEYYLYAENTETGETELIGKRMLLVVQPPIIVKQMPRTANYTYQPFNMKHIPPFVNLVSKTLSTFLNGQLYYEGEPYLPEVKNISQYILYDYFSFYFGGNITKAEPGDYVWNIWNECGEVWSDTCTLVMSEAGAVYSTTTSIIEGRNTLNVYPQPAQNTINLELGAELQSGVNIGLYDINSNLVKEFDFGNVSGKNHLFILEIGNLNLPNGMYFLRINSNNYTQFQKIVIFN